MSDNKDIDTTPVVETVVAEEGKPKADIPAAKTTSNADTTVDYWANAWANRGV